MIFESKIEQLKHFKCMNVIELHPKIYTEWHLQSNDLDPFSKLNLDPFISAKYCLKFTKIDWIFIYNKTELSYPKQWR